jgi:two-component system LytT family response regulator
MTNSCAPADLCDTNGRMTPSALRTLIVDDEPVARQILRDELETIADIEIAGEAANGADALTEIARIRPDLIFLDLEMPVLGGFDVIRRLPEGVLPIVIIVTAYDQHAIRAFDAGALDYLLKPVSREPWRR